MSARIRSLSWLSMLWWSMVASWRNREKGLLLLSSLSTELIPDMCMFRGLAVLRKALVNLSPSKRTTCCWKWFPGKASEVLHVSDNNFESQTVFGWMASTSDQGQNSEEHDLACLGSSPIVQKGSRLQGNKKIFEYPFKALLDHAWCDTEPPAIRISSRKTMPHVVTRFQRSTRILWSVATILFGVFVCLRISQFLVRWHSSLFGWEQSLSCEMTKLVSPSLDCALHAFFCARTVFVCLITSQLMFLWWLFARVPRT